MTLGLQLFSIAQELRQDLEGTLAEVARIGFRQVELAGFLGQGAPGLAAALRRAGLHCRSAHVPLRPYRPGSDPSLQDLPALVEAAQTLGLDAVIVPLFPLPERAGAPAAGESIEDYLRRAAALLGEEDWKALAAQLNRKAEALAPYGLRLGYHNHNVEFARCGQASGFELLLQHSDPDLVSFELDVGWARAASVDPVALLRCHPGRFRWLHLKDMAASTPVNTRFEFHPADLGKGVIDFPALLRTAGELGIGELIVEREPPFTRPALQTLAESWETLSRLGATASAPYSTVTDFARLRG